MNSLRMLGAIVIGAIIISTTYALAVRDRSVHWSSDSDEGRSVRHLVNGDRGEFSLKDEDRSLKAKWRGEFELSAEGNDIIDVDRSLDIEIDEDDVKERLDLKNDDGELVKTYYRNGDRQDAGAETDAAISALIVKFLRLSGLKAEERVGAILDNQNADAVLEEMNYLESDHALRRYAVALTESAELSPENITALADKLSNIESDHDLRRALSAILEHETVTAELTPALLNAANGIESDHDLRKLLEEFAEKPLTEDAMDIALGLFERIESDHDLRQAADAFLSSDALTQEQAARLLTAAADQIESGHDMRMILSESSGLFSQSDALTTAWLKGYDVLESSHDQRLSIAEAADIGGHPVAAWEMLIGRAGMIESSHEQRLALEAIAPHIEGEPELIAAYRGAAAKIESDHDRERTLGAIDAEEE